MKPDHLLSWRLNKKRPSGDIMMAASVKLKINKDFQ